MRVIAVRENPGKGSPEGVQQVFASSQLDELLAQSDYVVLAVPVTPGTNRMMDADTPGQNEIRCLPDQRGPRSPGG